jgi:hypothetical protein
VRAAGPAGAAGIPSRRRSSRGRGLTRVGEYPFPPWRREVGMGGRGAVLTPTRTLPVTGGGERFADAAHDILNPYQGESGGIRHTPMAR